MTKKKPKGKGLTPRQVQFVREYLLCRNATKAAQRAGYSWRAANREGSRLLSNVVIQTEIRKGELATQEKFEITQENIIQELAAVAFGHAGRVMSWSDEEVFFVPKADMSETEMKFIDSVSETQTEHGKSIKMTTMAGQKVKALELLGKHVGMWKEQDGGTGADPGDRKALLTRLSNHLRKRNADGGGTGGTGTAAA